MKMNVFGFKIGEDKQHVQDTSYKAYEGCMSPVTLKGEEKKKILIKKKQKHAQKHLVFIFEVPSQPWTK